MLKSHEKFHSINGKRQLLVVEDEIINRQILVHMLDSEFEVLQAADGEEALQVIRENHDTLSLVLLDLMMPNMNGIDVLKYMKADIQLQRIPVIVLTSEEQAEVESLKIGANDFIAKPYGKEILDARIHRTIELYEDREIIQSTERDQLTDLYTREYFFSYANLYDQHHKGVEMDAIVVDVNHFHMINERYGKAYGDEVLKRIAVKLKDVVNDSGGIVCRREADTFLVYCPHGNDYQKILENASVGLAGEDVAGNTRVRLRMGVYSNVDKTIDIERRIDRAKMAADTIRNQYTTKIAYYDSKLHDSELYAEQLVEDFHEAVTERQFKVYYQPKYYIQGGEPMLAGAEALVRWEHPKLGMLKPGIFVPVFEENGMITPLDAYVWREVAAQLKSWKERYGFSVPVSVNVSRVDMFDTNLVETFHKVLDDYDIGVSDLYLEITESAYTDDADYIIDTVNRLRDIGFRIEMDDFGTGYSSLGLISTLPIDAMKLDMVFVRNAFGKRKDMRMLEVIMGIADSLAVPVIAEGVETKEQMDALKSMGCAMVQGYYFSKPVPAEEFECFLQERMEQQSKE